MGMPVGFPGIFDAIVFRSVEELGVESVTDVDDIVVVFADCILDNAT